MDLGVINKQYVSAVDPMLDTRDIKKGVTDEAQENRLGDILNIAGRTRPVTQPIYYDFANQALFVTLSTAAATVTGSGTNTVTIAGLPTASSGVTRKDDLLMSQGGTNVVFFVSNVTTTGGQDTLVLQTVNGSTTTFTAGTNLNQFSRAVGERADSPVNLRFNLHKYTNKLQIFDEVSQISDVQKMSTIEVDFNGQPSYLIKDHIDKTIRLKTLINAAFWGGRLSITSFSDTTPFLVDTNAPTNGGGGGAVQTTRGINEYVEAYGVVTAAGTLGTVSFTDWDAMVAALYAARTPGDMMIYGSGQNRAIVDKFWKNLGSSGITSARLNVDGTDVNTQVDQVSYAGYNWNYVTMPIFNHPTIFAGTLIQKSLYFIPMNMQVETYDNATGTGGMRPAIEVCYFPSPGGSPASGDTSNSNGMWSEIQTGAYNTVNPNGRIREMRTEWVTYQGLQCLGSTMFGRMRIAA